MSTDLSTGLVRSVSEQSDIIRRIVKKKLLSIEEGKHFDYQFLREIKCPICRKMIVCIYAETEDNGDCLDNFIHTCSDPKCSFCNHSKKIRNDTRILPQKCGISGCDRQLNL